MQCETLNTYRNYYMYTIRYINSKYYIYINSSKEYYILNTIDDVIKQLIVCLSIPYINDSLINDIKHYIVILGVLDFNGHEEFRITGNAKQLYNNAKYRAKELKENLNNFVINKLRYNGTQHYNFNLLLKTFEDFYKVKL